jgi:hypothetical protein
MAYATVSDVQARMLRTLSTDEEALCGTFLDDVAVMIDGTNTSATADVKKVVSCRVVIRALGDGSDIGVPMGATQGSMSGLGYSQSWTISSGGSVGVLYFDKAERKMLGLSNMIGSYSPSQELVPSQEG